MDVSPINLTTLRRWLARCCRNKQAPCSDSLPVVYFVRGTYTPCRLRPSPAKARRRFRKKCGICSTSMPAVLVEQRRIEVVVDGGDIAIRADERLDLVDAVALVLVTLLVGDHVIPVVLNHPRNRHGVGLRDLRGLHTCSELV